MIGLFGGSFDPVHHAHLIVAQAVVEALGLSSLRFVPAREQPFKKRGHLAPAERRADMVALAIRGASRFALERDELEREGPSYTIETLRRLRAREPQEEFAWLVGADAAAELPIWRDGARIPELATVVVFARAGHPAPRLEYAHRVVEVPAMEISATEIRRRVGEGKSIRYWVPDAVEQYIAAHRLYRDGEA